MRGVHGIEERSVVLEVSMRLRGPWCWGGSMGYLGVEGGL